MHNHTLGMHSSYAPLNAFNQLRNVTRFGVGRRFIKKNLGTIIAETRLNLFTV